MSRIIRIVERLVASIEEDEIEIARINPSKTYKRRRKKSGLYRIKRRIYKIKMKNPGIKRKAAIKRKMYYRKNKPAIKRRQSFIRKAQKRTPKLPKQPA